GIEASAYWLKAFSVHRSLAIFLPHGDVGIAYASLAPLHMLLFAGAGQGTPMPSFAGRVPPPYAAIDPLSPAPLYLALGKAREAIAAAYRRNDLNDMRNRAAGYRLLGQAYQQLAELERTSAGPLPIREFQVRCALAQTLANDPSDADSNYTL